MTEIYAEPFPLTDDPLRVSPQSYGISQHDLDQQAAYMNGAAPAATAAHAPHATHAYHAKAASGNPILTVRP